VGVDERSINSTNLLLYWWIPVPAGVKFQFLPSYSEVNSRGIWRNHTEWVNNLQAYIVDLKPYTTYNLTVYVRIKGGNVFPPAKFATAITAEGGEST
jgi:hypothetical protein